MPGDSGDGRRALGTVVSPPDGGTVLADLLLPDRQTTLHLLDHVTACVERLGSVRSGGNHRDARLAGRNQTQPVPHLDSANLPALVGFLDNACQFAFSHFFVGTVLDCRDWPV